jgi:hypothetical protein
MVTEKISEEKRIRIRETGVYHVVVIVVVAGATAVCSSATVGNANPSADFPGGDVAAGKLEVDNVGDKPGCDGGGGVECEPGDCVCANFLRLV